MILPRLCYTVGMASQLMLFRTETTDNGDGSWTVRPIEVKFDREIRLKKAMAILGYSKDEVNRLCQLGAKHGGLDAYKLPSKNGNAPWRIDWLSVTRYKADLKAKR